MVTEDDEELDPRAQLIKQLKAYEVIKYASESLDQLPRMERELFQAKALVGPGVKPQILPPDVSLAELARAFANVLNRVEANAHHEVKRENLSTRERMSQILAMLNGEDFIPFTQLFKAAEGRAGVVVTFLALMELVKEMLVELYQREPLTMIYVKAR